MQVSAVLLAAGNSTRFGGNKLLEPYKGLPLYEHTLQNVRSLPFQQIILVTQYEAIAAQLAQTEIELAINPHPEQGISSSIRQGLLACRPCEGIMFFVCDQPGLKRESIEGMLSLFAKDPTRMVSAAYGDRRGNPVIFPYRLRSELMNLQGEQGGSFLLQEKKREVERYFVSYPQELMDIDKKSDWEQFDRD